MLFRYDVCRQKSSNTIPFKAPVHWKWIDSITEIDLARYTQAPGNHIFQRDNPTEPVKKILFAFDIDETILISDKYDFRVAQVIEPEICALVKMLNESPYIETMGLTARKCCSRYEFVIDLTDKQLSNFGVSFSCNFPTLYFDHTACRNTETHSPIFAKNILFTDLNVQKGDALYGLLPSIMQHISAIHVIDDRKDALDSIIAAVTELNAAHGTRVSVTAYHYQRLENLYRQSTENQPPRP